MKFETSIIRRLSGRHKVCLNMEKYENKKILDIGCGTGYLLNSLHPKFAIGIDKNTGMVKYAKKHYPKYDFINLDIEKTDRGDF